MKIGKDDVLRLAEMVRIDVSTDEVDGIAGDLDRVLRYFEDLEEVDTSAISHTARIFEGYAELREDEPRPGLSHQDLDHLGGDSFDREEGVFVLQGVFENTERPRDS